LAFEGIVQLVRENINYNNDLSDEIFLGKFSFHS